jgi:hypothetical protein
MTTPQLLETPDAKAKKRRIDSIRRVSNRLFIALVVLLTIGGVLMFYSVLFEGKNDVPVPSTPVLCMIIGAVGGFVGLQRRLKQLGEDDLELLETSWACVALAPMVGGILALLLYMLFLSKLVSSPLFPTFVLDSDVDGAVTWQNFLIISHVHGDFDAYGKLAFWSFVAGFSEPFVVDVVSQFAAKGSKGDAKE